MVVRRPPALLVLAMGLCVAAAMSCSSTARKQAPDAGKSDTTPAPPGGGTHGVAITTESAVWDFGSIKRGETVTHTMMLRNNTEHALVLDVHTSCDCLNAEFEDSLVPGESARELRISFMGDVIKERTTKTIQVDVRDQPEEKVKITVTGRVTKGDGPHIEVLPTILLFEKAEDAYWPARLRVMNAGRADLEITEMRCFGCVASHGDFLLEEDEEIEIEVMLEEEWPEENRWLEIDSNDPVDEIKKVPLVIVE